MGGGGWGEVQGQRTFFHRFSTQRLKTHINTHASLPLWSSHTLVHSIIPSTPHDFKVRGAKSKVKGEGGFFQ